MDWSSPAAIEQELAAGQAPGPVAGLIHALPLRRRRDAGARSGRLGRPDGGSRSAGCSCWRRAGPRPRAAARRGRSLPDRGDAHGRGVRQRRRRPADFFPGQGAIAGLVKTLAREWPRSAPAWSTWPPAWIRVERPTIC